MVVSLVALCAFGSTCGPRFDAVLNCQLLSYIQRTRFESTDTPQDSIGLYCCTHRRKLKGVPREILRNLGLRAILSPVALSPDGRYLIISARSESFGKPGEIAENVSLRCNVWLLKVAGFEASKVLSSVSIPDMLMWSPRSTRCAVLHRRVSGVLRETSSLISIVRVGDSEAISMNLHAGFGSTVSWLTDGRLALGNPSEGKVIELSAGLSTLRSQNVSPTETSMWALSGTNLFLAAVSQSGTLVHVQNYALRTAVGRIDLGSENKVFGYVDAKVPLQFSSSGKFLAGRAYNDKLSVSTLFVWSKAWNMERRIVLPGYWEVAGLDRRGLELICWNRIGTNEIRVSLLNTANLKVREAFTVQGETTFVSSVELEGASCHRVQRSL